MKILPGNWVIVRCLHAGVHHGRVLHHDGQEIILEDARRLWRWSARKGCALSGVAVHGLYDGRNEDRYSRIDSKVSEVWLGDAVEIIVCSAEASDSIVNYPDQAAE